MNHRMAVELNFIGPMRAFDLRKSSLSRRSSQSLELAIRNAPRRNEHRMRFVGVHDFAMTLPAGIAADIALIECLPLLDRNNGDWLNRFVRTPRHQAEPNAADEQTSRAHSRH